MGKRTHSFEGICLLNGKPNTVFFTPKKDRDITAIANYYARKVNTERLIVVSGSKENPKAETITKVTIIL